MMQDVMSVRFERQRACTAFREDWQMKLQSTQLHACL